MMDRHHAESAAVDALSRGFIPRDLAASIMAMSLVGHDT